MGERLMNALYYMTLLAGFLIIYHHVLYPIILKKLGRKASDTLDVVDCDNEKPSIHLIIPAYNEAAFIAQKVKNLSELNYPSRLLKVTIIGDGCCDNTIEIARNTLADLALGQSFIEIEAHSDNRGKVAVLNQAIGQSQSDIIALSDVSAMISPNAMLRAAAYFQDPKIGVVNSVYRFAQASSAGEQAYWDYQSRIKQLECNTGSVIGVHGALYFIRRDLCVPLSEDTINDDFILPMQAVVQGFHAYQADDIIATELETVNKGADNRRRMRIAAGNLQQAIRLKGLMKPAFKGVAFNFFSGKVLRVLMPWCLLFFFIASIILATGSPLFAILAIGQSAFYLIGTVEHYKKNKTDHRLIAVIYYFAAGHWFSLLGMFRYLTKLQSFKV